MDDPEPQGKSAIRAGKGLTLAPQRWPLVRDLEVAGALELEPFIIPCVDNDVSFSAVLEDKAESEDVRGNTTL